MSAAFTSFHAKEMDVGLLNAAVNPVGLAGGVMSNVVKVYKLPLLFSTTVLPAESVDSTEK